MGDKKYGANTEYRMLHYWVEKQLGKPSTCWDCGSRDRKRYAWANVSGKYRKDVSDWKRLCYSCHLSNDLGKICKKGLHELAGNNVYHHPDGSRVCITCKQDYMKKWRAKRQIGGKP